MKKLLVILLSVPCLCWGTRQTMEKIVYCGVTNHLVNIPLTEELGDKIKFMPASTDGATHEFTISTACYRGYEGLWEVKGDTLFLNELRNVSGDLLAVSNLIAGATYPVPAWWFSGNLRFSKTQFCLSRADCGCYDLFSNEVVVPVKNGKVSGKIVVIDRRKEREDFRASVEPNHDSLEPFQKDQYHFSFFADRNHRDAELTDLVTCLITNQVSFSARVQVFATDGKKSYGSDFRLIPTEEHRIYQLETIYSKMDDVPWSHVHFVAFSGDKMITLLGTPKREWKPPSEIHATDGSVIYPLYRELTDEAHAEAFKKMIELRDAVSAAEKLKLQVFNVDNEQETLH